MSTKTKTINIEPAPFSYDPSGLWGGIDGNWSSFTVQVGTPPQGFLVFPSTAGQELLFPYEGCYPGAPVDCPSSRGVLPFEGIQDDGIQINASSDSTWNLQGLFTAQLENYLGIYVDAIYGDDTVVLGNNGSSQLSLATQVVGAVQDENFWLGTLGLVPGNIGLAGLNGTQLSFMANLVNSKDITGHSYAYTAGAVYRNSLGSLTLGGFDSSRYAAPGIGFPFAVNGTSPLQVTLQNIQGENTLSGTSELLSSSINVQIDSTLPYIWLPNATCDAIASAFGLIYDNRTDLYLSNETIREQFIAQQSQPSVIFEIGVNIGETKSITLPYSAFDLEVTYPIYENATRYFPIRRANTTQYTLGRTFLQEAYLIVDYDRENFTIASAIAASTPMIVPIHPPKQQSTKHTLSTGAKAGIAVAVALVLLMLIVITTIVTRKKRSRRIMEKKAKIGRSQEIQDQYPMDTKKSCISPGLDATSSHEMEIIPQVFAEVEGETGKWGKFGLHEMATPLMRTELEAGYGPHELWASGPGAHELQGSEVPKAPGDDELAKREEGNINLAKREEDVVESAKHERHDQGSH